MTIVNEYLKYQEKHTHNYGINSIVLLMVGSFYEMYGCDNINLDIIKNVSKLLNIQMTMKNKKKSHSISNPYMCGFPVYALSKHLSKLLLSNYTVVVYNQHDNPDKKAGKIRKLSTIYSPGTYVDEEIIDNTTITCILVEKYHCPIDNKYKNSLYISSIDVSTGYSDVYECYNNDLVLYDEISRNIYSKNPSEIILLGDIFDYNFVYNNFGSSIIHHYKTIDKKYFNAVYQYDIIEKIFDTSNYAISPVEYIGLECHGELLGCYIYLLQFVYEHDPHIIKRIYKPEFIHSNSSLYIGGDALYQLNLLYKNKQQLNGANTRYTCIFDVIDKTQTKMGRRLLKYRLLSPITDTDELNNRYDIIEHVKPNYKEYRNLLQNILDIEKKYRKILLKKLHPYEFSMLNESFNNIQKILLLGKDIYNIPREDIDRFSLFYEEYLSIFDIDKLSKYNMNNIKSSFFKDGIYPEIDTAMTNINTIKNIFNSFIEYAKERGKDSIIKLDYTEKSGYSFSITKKRWESITSINYKFTYNDKNYKILSKDFTKTAVGRTNYKLNNNVLDKLSTILAELENNIGNIVKDKYINKLSEIGDKYSNLFDNIITHISEIDISICSCHVSTLYAYNRPIIDNTKERSFIETTKLRHPLIERIHDNVEYITNDLNINEDTHGILLYGINSSGKSSLLRSIGVNLILAQIGMFVSADTFVYKPFTKIITKISNMDNLFKGQSTFIVEMKELKHILENADKSSLILSDELTSGTETNSATGIVTSTIKHLLNISTNFIFTTHLHSIMKFTDVIENYYLRVCHFNVTIDNDGSIIYDRILRDGSGNHLYGIEIAQSIGLDKEFIKDAYKYRAQEIGNTVEILLNNRSKYNTRKIIDQCEQCGSNKNLHTHHIHEQKDANKDGIIKHFHKNSLHNLMILCQKCHTDHHNNTSSHE
jgi:DNA mismatch repair protein MutS